MRNEKHDTLNLLVVDSEPATELALADALSGVDVVIHCAETLKEARTIAKRDRIDVAVVGALLSDGNGLDLTCELHNRYPSVRSIVVIGHRSYRGAIDAIRAGANDYLAKPFHPIELGRCLERVLQTCRCGVNDRKPRYAQSGVANSFTQNASNPHAIVEPLIRRFISAVENELDLEVVLRRSLEIVLHEVGATNAAVFLPAFHGGLVLGGYVNYDMERDSIEILLDGMSGTIEQTIRSQDSDDAGWRKCPTESADWLREMDVRLLPCWEGGELVAAVLLFRSEHQPFQVEPLNALYEVAPILAKHLKKVIRVHHRLRLDDKPADNGFGDSGEAFI